MVETPAPAKHRMASLDFLRFIAAFAVMLYHFTLPHQATVAGWSASAVLTKSFAYGYLGVHLFFFISGYVILMSAWGRDVIAFVASRVSRIYPAYLAGVVLAAALMYFRPDYTGGLKLSNVLLNLTMMNKLAGIEPLSGVFWTLWTELRFYVLVAVLIHLGLTKGRVLVFAFLWPYLAMIAAQNQWTFLSELLISDHAAIFAAGMVLFLIVRDGWSIGAGLVMILDVVLASAKVYTEALRLATSGSHPIRPHLAVAVYFLCFLAVVVAASPRLRSMESRTLSWCGLLTYPLYLVHASIGAFTAVVLRPSSFWVATGVATIATILVAIAFHYLFEKPWHRRLRIAVDQSLREFAHEEALAGQAATAAPSGVRREQRDA